MAGQRTPATTLLTRLGVWFRLHPYSHDARAGSYGTEAVSALGLDPQRVFKTLVADMAGALVVGVVPVSAQLDLQALAAAAGGKRATLALPVDAERATGYVTGGISPLGHRRRLPVVVDDSARDHESVFCSAGRRGLQLELSPADLVTVTDAMVAPITAA